jgi:hypothetical protein
MAEEAEWIGLLKEAAKLWGYRSSYPGHYGIELLTHDSIAMFDRYQSITDPLMRLGDTFANGSLHSEEYDLSNDKLEEVAQKWQDVKGNGLFLQYAAWKLLKKIETGDPTEEELENYAEIAELGATDDRRRLAEQTGTKLLKRFERLKKIFEFLRQIHPNDYGAEGSVRRNIHYFAEYVYNMMKLYEVEFRAALNAFMAGDEIKEHTYSYAESSDEGSPSEDKRSRSPGGPSSPPSMIPKRPRDDPYMPSGRSTTPQSPYRSPEYVEAMASGSAKTLTPKRGRPRDDPYAPLSDSDEDAASTKSYFKEPKFKGGDISSSDDEETVKGRGFVHLIL